MDVGPTRATRLPPTPSGTLPGKQAPAIVAIACRQSFQHPVGPAKPGRQPRIGQSRRPLALRCEITPSSTGPHPHYPRRLSHVLTDRALAQHHPPATVSRSVAPRGIAHTVWPDNRCGELFRPRHSADRRSQPGPSPSVGSPLVGPPPPVARLQRAALRLVSGDGTLTLIRDRGSGDSP
jgi:hypothetical protein